MKVVSFHLTTESCTTTSLMTTRNWTCGLYARIWKTTTTNICRLIAERWVRQVHLNEHGNLEWNHLLRWMGFTSVSCSMDAYILVSALRQHLKWTSGAVAATKATLAFVTQIVTYQLWSPVLRARTSIDLARETLFISILKLKNPPSMTERRQPLLLFKFYPLFLRKYKELLIQQRK